MYVCMYVCVHIRTHTGNTQVYAYIRTHTYIHTYIHTYMHTCTHTYIHTYIHTYTFGPVCLNMAFSAAIERSQIMCTERVCIYIHTHVYTHTHTHTYTYIHTYIHTYTFGPVCPNMAFSAAIERSQIMCKICPPPTAYPAIMAITGLGQRLISICTYVCVCVCFCVCVCVCVCEQCVRAISACVDMHACICIHMQHMPPSNSIPQCRAWAAQDVELYMCVCVCVRV
jgi:hypothetical protein